jgi:hypothetical protein
MGSFYSIVRKYCLDVNQYMGVQLVEYSGFVSFFSSGLTLKGFDAVSNGISVYFFGIL